MIIRLKMENYDLAVMQLQSIGCVDISWDEKKRVLTGFDTKGKKIATCQVE